MKRALTVLAFALLLASRLAATPFENCGLLLLKTDPAGCDISIDGVSVGCTPRLITDLDASGVYKVRFRKEGYLDQEIKVKFEGRKPVVREERMVSASGAIEAISTPAGATVTINGVSRGVTPLVVSGVPKGRATVEFHLDGFIDEKRELKVNAGDEQTLAIALRALPGTLHLSSIPEGARFYVNGVLRGKGPLALPGLMPGEYAVRAELAGHDTLERKVALANGESASEEFRMTSVMGHLEVRTSPAGAQVELDGKVVGVTKESGAADEFSAPLPIDGLLAGEHRLVVRKEGYAEAVRHPEIRNSKTSRHKVRLKRVFVPDVELVTSHGTYRGILKANTQTAVIVEVSLGIEQSFPRTEIRKITFLTDAP